MRNITYFAPGSVDWNELTNTLAQAQEDVRTLRFESGEDKNGPWVKVKVGEGMWSPPLYGEQDPNQG